MNNFSPDSACEHEEDLSDLIAARAPVTPASNPTEGGLEGLPPLLAALVRGVGEPAPRQFLGGIFADIVRLLGQLEGLKGAVGRGASPDAVRHVLGALKKSSSYLLTNIETAELRVEGLPDPLVEALEAAAFALRHEMRRVFETELAAPADGGAPRPQAVLRACALLENCLQQLTICFARTFEPAVTGAALFESYRRRREQSLALREELRVLLTDIRRAEREFSVLTGLALLNRVNRFRRECLHYLLYRDWEDFERFADAVGLCYESEEESGALLHKFSCYVEALLSQIEMRAVLAEG